MKYILLLIIVALVAGYALPAQREDAATPCGALDKRVQHLVDAEIAKLPQSSNPKAQSAAAAARAQFPGGAAIAGFVRDRVPFLPPEFACAAAYWLSVYQPDPHLLLGLAAPRG